MKKTILFCITGLFIGLLSGFLATAYGQLYTKTSDSKLIQGLIPPKKTVIGFLPYWLLDKADKNYSPYITTLTYFGLTIDDDGHIEKYTDDNGTEGEPGLVALESGKVESTLAEARKQHLDLSLLVFKSDNEAISELLTDPEVHADALISDVAPIMQQYHFKDLNIDIESTANASDDARARFTRFIKRVKAGIDKRKLGTLTVEISAGDLIRTDLINAKEVGEIADNVVIMSYDYHFIGSDVTGPVAPAGGAGREAEYDVQVALQKALAIIDPEKIILGIPLYGYQWETIGNTPRSAVIPGTGQTASNRRVEEYLDTCPSCSVKEDSNAKESYLIYQDDPTGVYEQFFYPTTNATKAKITLAEASKLGGIALWALGYEGDTILNPLKSYQ